MPTPFLPFESPDIFKPRPAITPIPPRPPGIIDAQIVPISNNPGIEVVKIPPPTPTPTPPITPRPTIPTPRVTSPTPPASSYRTGGRIAGGFFPKFVPPGVGGFLFRRAIPGVSWLLLAYDLYQLGCQTGVLGETICPSSRNPLPGLSSPFKGGQCRAVRYFVRWNYNFISPPSAPTYHEFPVWGPIYEISGPYDPSYSNSNGYRVLCHGAAEYQTFRNSPDWVDILFTTNSTNNINYTGVTLVRTDGLADNCGDPPGTPIARTAPVDVVNITNLTNNNINIINPPRILPPRPAPKLPPIIITPPSPLPVPYDNPDPQPQPQPRPQPQPEPTAQPQPNLPQPTPEPPIIVIPIPTPIPQPNPIPPPRPRDFDFSNCDPCSLYTMRGVYEILDKLYRVNTEILQIQETQAYHSKVLENLQKLVDVELEGAHILKRCDDIETVFSYKGKALTGLNKHVEQLEKMNDIIVREICSIEAETQIAAPDWWQVRLGSNIPQIAVVFRRRGHSNYYSLVVPHPKNTTMPTTSPLPAYTKGNFQGMVICIDNSKFICNCASAVEADRMCSLAIQLIDENYLENPPRIHISERKGQAVSVDSMLPRACMYYPTGQRNFVPEWRVAFNRNDPIEQA